MAPDRRAELALIVDLHLSGLRDPRPICPVYVRELLDSEQHYAAKAELWRPVSDAPPQGVPLLVSTAGTPIRPARGPVLAVRVFDSWRGPNGATLPISPTHWCPLPDPPAG